MFGYVFICLHSQVFLYMSFEYINVFIMNLIMDMLLYIQMKNKYFLWIKYEY